MDPSLIRLDGKKRPFSRAEWTGFFCLPVSILLGFIDLKLMAIPLGMFVSACLVFPFFPASQFFLPVISKGVTPFPAVSLTFDDGPDPAVTPLVLALLKKHGVKAAFFVIGEKAGQHPDIIRRIVSDGHGVGNHSFTHDPLIMFRSTRRLIGEIVSTERLFHALGFSSRVFRPPVGITTSRHADALRHTGLTAVTFSNRGADMGNRRISGLSDRILGKAGGNDIILLHDVRPKGQATVDEWLVQVEEIIVGLQRKGLTIVPLDTLTGQPVMTQSKIGSHEADVL